VTARHAPLVALLFLLSPAAARAQAWVDINPGAGGAFTTIGAGPTGTIICGGDLSGAYRSVDRGASWTVLGANHGLKETHVRAVAFDPVDPNLIYLGSDAGIYRSMDGGNTLVEVSTPGYVSAIAAAPGHPAIVYAGCHVDFASGIGAVYRSDDRGSTWRPVSINLPAGIRILKLLVAPTNPQVVYLLSGADLFVPSASPWLFRSTDGGVSWSRIGESLGNLWDVAMDPGTPNLLYATTYVGVPEVSWTGAVCKSIDGGNTWTQKASHTGAIVVTRNQPRVVRVIDVARGSSSPGAAEAGVWESADGGATWNKKSTPSAWDPGWQILTCFAYEKSSYGVAQTLGQDLSDPNVIFWVTKQFVYASFDGGLTFQDLFTNQASPGWWRSRGIENVTVAALAMSAADPARIFTGYHDIGLWRSLDGGTSWQECNNAAFTGNWKWCGGNTTTVVADPVRADRVWASMGVAADTSTLVRSATAGAASGWIGVSGLPVGFLKGLSLDPTSPAAQRTLFVTDNGDVYRSLDDGATWSLSFPCGICRTTAVDAHDGSLVYTGGEGGLWQSTRGGAPGTWVSVGPAELAGGSPVAVKEEQWTGVHEIAPDPQQSGTVYVAAYGSGKGIYRGTGRGSSWSKLRDGAYTRGVAIDPTNSNVIFATSSRALKAGGPAAGSEGVLCSIDGGASWVSLNGNLAWPFAAQIAIDPSNHARLIVGSPGTGFSALTLILAVRPARVTR